MFAEGLDAGAPPVKDGEDKENVERNAERESWQRRKKEVAEKHLRDRQEWVQRHEKKYSGDPDAADFDQMRGRNGPVSTRGGMSMTDNYAEFFMPKASISRDLCTAWVHSLAHSSSNRFGKLGADASEELPRVRMYVTESTTPILLVEFNSPRTFNMMDTIFVSDMNLLWDAFAQFKGTKLKREPLSYFVQGAGAHFCPGGNPNAVPDPGTTPFQMHQYNISLPFQRFRELAMPGTCAMHGSAVGGGVAISLNTTFRFAVQNLTLSFGNLSRGAVPCMDLSRNLHRRMGLSSAMNIYLTDATVSAKGAHDFSLVKEICRTVHDTKTKAYMFANRIVESSYYMALHRTTVTPINTSRYCHEGYAMSLAGRSGEQFANVRAPKLSNAAKATRARLTGHDPSTNDSEQGWGPGNADPVACGYCGKVTSAGWWGWGEFSDEFFCNACWSKVPALVRLEAQRTGIPSDHGDGTTGPGPGSNSMDEEFLDYLKQYSDVVE